MSPSTILIYISLAAVITLALRVLPFVIFGGKRQLPAKLTVLGDMLPAAIMAVLVVYCLKTVPWDFSGTGIWQLVAAVVVAISFKWKHNTFLSIVLGTVLYMILIRL